MYHTLNIKTLVPPLIKNLLPRPLLVQSLKEGLLTEHGFSRQLTLVSAPAGFGKTTFVRSLISGQESQTTWYSLDKSDDEPNLFWTYVIRAFQNLNKNTGNSSLQILRSGDERDFPTETILVPLLNDLLSVDSFITLVIDDYHLVNNHLIHESMGYFIENLPPTVHVIVTTRSDPPWLLPRWRAKESMKEVRLKDLKLSEDEALQVLSQRGVSLTETQHKKLYSKTDGWITGLNLAAASLLGTQNAERFISSFAGSHRHILHFLMEEVFNQQWDTIQSFLMETSILDRLCAPLCDVVTEGNDSERILSILENNNIFLVPLDSEGIWYRYHPLFSEILLFQLKKKNPQKIKLLHERAAHWYISSGEPHKAINHALAIDNFEMVAKIFHDNTDLIREENPLMLSKLTELLTDDILKSYPKLIAYKAYTLLIKEGSDTAKTYIELANNLRYDDPTAQNEYKGLLESIKTYYFISINKINEALASAEMALQLLPYKNSFWRMGVSIFYGDIMFFSGRPKEALPFYESAHQNNMLRGSHYQLISGFKIAINLYYLGRLKESEELSRQMLSLANKEGLSQFTRVGFTGPY